MNNKDSMEQQSSQLFKAYHSILQHFQQCLNQFKVDLDRSLNGLETTLGDKRIDAASARGISFMLKSNIKAYKELKQVLDQLEQNQVDYTQFHQALKRLDIHKEKKNSVQDDINSIKEPPRTLYEHISREEAQLQRENTHLSIELNELHQLEQRNMMEQQLKDNKRLQLSIQQLQSDMTLMRQQMNLNRIFNLRPPLSSQPPKKSFDKMATIDDPKLNTLRVAALHSLQDGSDNVFQNMMQEYGHDVSNLIRMHSELFNLQSPPEEDDDKTPFASESSLADQQDIIRGSWHDVATETVPLPRTATSVPLSRFDMDHLRHQAQATLQRWYTASAQYPWISRAALPLTYSTPRSIQNSVVMLARYYCWN